MQKYGFVYIWFDRKHKRYYIGCHWGTEDDGYVCSSSWMKQAYKLRPNDFKRRILKTNIDSREKTYLEEQKWLDKIDISTTSPNSNTPRYYNLKTTTNEVWHKYESQIKSIGEKISKAHKNSPDFGKWNEGKVRSEETKKRISNKLRGRKLSYERSDETKKLISENNKRLQKEKKIGMHGKNHRSETIQKMKANNAMKNPEHIAKVKASKQGIKWLTNGQVKKMAVPGSDKYLTLIDQGFNPL